MEQHPLITVVLPVRNAEKTLEAALRSVLDQTFRSLEVVTVDDGSTDGTAEILRAAASRDPRLSVVRADGTGIAAALNQGIRLARGKYLARQDADDTSLPERFERQVGYLDAHPSVGAVGTGGIIIDEFGCPIGHFPIRAGAPAVRRSLLAARATPIHGSMMIRREALASVGGYRERFVACQDFDLWLRLLEQWEIDNISDPLYRWRLTSQSVYGGRRRSQLMYCGIALAFADERRRFGTDSYDLLQRTPELEAFAEGYRLRGLLRACWGELLLRGGDDPHRCHEHFRLAIRQGHARPRTVLLWAWTSAGLPWLGGKPLRPASQPETAPDSGP